MKRSLATISGALCAAALVCGLVVFASSPDENDAPAKVSARPSPTEGSLRVADADSLQVEYEALLASGTFVLPDGYQWPARIPTVAFAPDGAGEHPSVTRMTEIIWGCLVIDAAWQHLDIDAGRSRDPIEQLYEQSDLWDDDPVTLDHPNARTAGWSGICVQLLEAIS